MPTTGAWRRVAPIDPEKVAPPKAKTPPSEAVVQYPGRGGGGGGAGGSPAGPEKAWTWLDDAASKSPSATAGVGKWLATAPREKLWTPFPVLGSSPRSVVPPMVHTSPPATIGGAPAADPKSV